MDYALQGGGNAKRNPGDSSVLWEVVSQVGFSSVAAGVSGAGSGGYRLGMSGAITDGAAVWIHSREDSGSGVSGLKVSTHFLYVDSSVLAAYQGAQAMAASANSYGGSTVTGYESGTRDGQDAGIGFKVQGARFQGRGKDGGCKGHGLHRASGHRRGAEA